MTAANFRVLFPGLLNSSLCASEGSCGWQALSQGFCDFPPVLSTLRLSAHQSLSKLFRNPMQIVSTAQLPSSLAPISMPFAACLKHSHFPSLCRLHFSNLYPFLLCIFIRRTSGNCALTFKSREFCPVRNVESHYTTPVSSSLCHICLLRRINPQVQPVCPSVRYVTVSRVICVYIPYTISVSFSVSGSYCWDDKKGRNGNCRGM